MSEQEKFEQEYPKRVTLGEDGVYRWRYEMDLKHNLFMFKFVLKILVAVFLFCDAMMLILSEGSSEMLSFALILTAAMVGIWGIAYWIWGVASHWTQRFFFEMDQKEIALIQPPSVQKRGAVLGLIVAVLGVAARKPGSIGTGMAIGMGSRTSYCRLASVRRLKQHRKNDVIALWMLIFGMQVYVPPEDYDFVLDHISEKVPARVRREPEGKALKRLGLACLASLILNGISFAVNYFSYQSTMSLPLSISLDEGGCIEQRAFGMKVYHFFESDGVTWAEDLTDFYYDIGLAVVGFVLVALAFFLLFSLFSLLKRRSRGE